MIIILMPIDGYFIIRYWWLLMVIILMPIDVFLLLDIGGF